MIAALTKVVPISIKQSTERSELAGGDLHWLLKHCPLSKISQHCIAISGKEWYLHYLITGGGGEAAVVPVEVGQVCW